MLNPRICFFLLAIHSTLMLHAQSITWETLAPMPEPVSNNAVTVAEIDGVPHVFSFAGIDESRDWFGIHLRSFRFNTVTELWETIPPLPGQNGGKIAAAASTVKNKVYIIGGYHVASNYSEASSNKVHIYDPETNAYLPDGADIPIPIDDQVQAVWRDSLIYVITGWSNNGNVVNVQIYNPTEDSWMAGTPVPNNSQWKVFGGSGAIIGDTIYYAGGAKSTSGFGPSTLFRKGYINPDNPAEVTWEGYSDPASRGYRMAAGAFDGRAIWLGGSDVTYNFDGIAYNGSGGVPALGRLTFYDPPTGMLHQLQGVIPPIMDLRGLAQVSPNQFIIAGGMGPGQLVADQVLRVTIEALTEVRQQIEQPPSLFLYPNPARQSLWIQSPEPVLVELANAQGQVMFRRNARPGEEIQVGHLPEGWYVARFWKGAHPMNVQHLILR